MTEQLRPVPKKYDAFEKDLIEAGIKIPSNFGKKLKIDMHARMLNVADYYQTHGNLQIPVRSEIRHELWNNDGKWLSDVKRKTRAKPKYWQFHAIKLYFPFFEAVK